MIKKLTQQLKEPERDHEGIEFQVESSDGSDVVISSQSKLEIRGKKRNSRFAKKKLQELVEESRFNPKYFENRITLKKAKQKQLARYNEAEYMRPSGV